MKPAPFKYYVPNSLEEAVNLYGSILLRWQNPGRRPELDPNDELPPVAA